MKEKRWNVCVYTRLSKEDGAFESNSITNQKALIYSYLEKSRDDFNIVSEKSDDGYSGLFFDRPQFTEMMEEIKNDIVDCVVVKDLSRLGRDYIETGNYLENLFPFLGVRFIAINDNYDSLQNHSNSDFILPFKNLMNDSYSRDISIKTKTQLHTKMKKGEFISSFAPFGYKKSYDNHNKLVIDEEASQYVKKIFKMKIKGYSHAGIASYYNELSIPSPAEYKKRCGEKYSANLQKNVTAQWNHKSIERILENEIYIGHLVQSKTQSINHKISKRIKSEHPIVLKDVHEPIITDNDFSIVQRLLHTDLRISPATGLVPLFSALLTCDECGRNFVRKTVPRKNKTDIYYVCRTNKSDKNVCYHTNIRNDDLYDMVFTACKEYASTLVNIGLELSDMAIEKQRKIKLTLLTNNKNHVMEQMDKNKEYKNNLYAHYQENLFNKDDFIAFNQEFTRKLQELQISLKKIEIEIENVNKDLPVEEWMSHVKKYNPIKKLDRVLLLNMVEEIRISKDKDISIHFAYADEMQELQQLCKQSLDFEEVLAHG